MTRATRRTPPSTEAHQAHQGQQGDRFLWPAFAIFLVALSVRLIHVWQIRRAPFFTVLIGDSRAYDAWAQEIARGDWVGHGIFYQAPLYPYFLGAVYSMAGHHLTVLRICQAIVGSVSCTLLGLSGWRFFSRPAGLAAGLMLALYAPAIFFDSLVQKSLLDVFFICLMLWLLSGLSAKHPESYWPWFSIGLALGALTLTRENALIFAVVILLWIATRGWRVGKEQLLATGMFVLGLAMVLAPVAVRNRIVGGEFHLTTAQFGPNFYIGNNADANGAYNPLREGRGSAVYEREDATRLAEYAAGRHLTPAEVSRYWTDQALAFIRAHPAAWLKLLGRKFRLLWNATEMMDTESQQRYADWSTPVRLAATFGHFGVLVPLALFGIVVTWPRRSRLWVLHGMLAAYALSVLMFYVFARYRYPLVPFLVLFAAAGITAAGRFVRTMPVQRVAATVAAVTVVAILVNQPLLSADVQRAITESNLGEALQADGRYDEAIVHYRQAIAFSPGWAGPYNNIGTAFRSQGRVDQAILLFQQALALQPNYSRAHYNLGVALLAAGKPNEAIEHIREALPSMMDLPDAHRDLGIALAAEGRTNEAIAEFREALRLDPDSATVHRTLGESLASQGALPEAMDHFRRALQLNPDDNQAHLDLSAGLLDVHQFEEAAMESGAALRLNMNSVEAHNNLGVALASQGRLEEAVQQFQQALKIQPEFADARRNLETALHMSSRAH
jgi:tetratricopeptide (TPR) repeat protein/4-amino-4-deoxy-L-arabinose transferase-like glycosyltransferase